MPVSSRFAVAVHILTLLDVKGGRPATSEYIASSVNTNPGVIRRLLGQLARAGLTTSRLGAGGGSLLAKPAAHIRLVDAYRAVESGRVFALHHATPSARCPVGRHIQSALSSVVGRAERALEEELAEVTVADMVASVGARGRPKVGNLPRR
jgi:Rrf2 family protein